MSKPTLTGTDLESLMKMLASKQGLIRQKARKSLVAIGNRAVPSLIEALGNSRLKQVRWEAAKTLGTIGDPRSILPLVKALEDDNADVAWLAAEALKQFKKAAWPLLLKPLLEHGEKSALLCQGVHHVLLKQKEDGFNDLLTMLLSALNFGADPEAIPLAAYDILKRLKLKL